MHGQGLSAGGQKSTSAGTSWGSLWALVLCEGCFPGLFQARHRRHRPKKVYRGGNDRRAFIAFGPSSRNPVDRNSRCDSNTDALQMRTPRFTFTFWQFQNSFIKKSCKPHTPHHHRRPQQRQTHGFHHQRVILPRIDCQPWNPSKLALFVYFKRKLILDDLNPPNPSGQHLQQLSLRSCTCLASCIAPSSTIGASPWDCVFHGITQDLLKTEVCPLLFQNCWRKQERTNCC